MRVPKKRCGEAGDLSGHSGWQHECDGKFSAAGNADGGAAFGANRPRVLARRTGGANEDIGDAVAIFLGVNAVVIITIAGN